MVFWDIEQKILVVLAHPDDPEFFCGGTLSIWAKEGHEVVYCLLTKGDKGVNENFKGVDDIKQLRMDEQKKAAEVIGVHKPGSVVRSSARRAVPAAWRGCARVTVL